MQSFTQKSKGSCTMVVDPKTPHCGVGQNAITFEYAVEFTFSDAALDDDGFLFDAMTFRTYFAKLSGKTLQISCERLARQICRDFMMALGERRFYCNKAKVWVEPIPGTGVEFCFNRE